MGLRCIMGHDYGEAQRTEEREESGDERVVTVREYRECRRCGHRKTISENTEVRTSETADPDDSGGAAETRSGTDAGTTGDAPGGTAHPSMGREPAPADPGTGGGRAPSGTAGPAAGGEPPGATAERDSPGDGEDVTAAEDDGVILEDDADDADRERGEWPEADDVDDDRAGEDDPGGNADAETSGAGRGDWPTPDGDDRGYSAEPSSGEPADGVEFGGGLTPESAETPAGTAGGPPSDAGTTPGGSGDRTADAGSGIARADAEPAARQPPAGADAVLACPRCDHTAPPMASSLRPGDICPDCGQGYLTEREE